MRYKDYSPTPLDRNIRVDVDGEDRGEWIVAPCSHTRDSGMLDESNFASALEILGGESGTVEVHRFSHWGPGWIEIILVDPSREAEVDEIKASLESYPLLDEEDLSERECEFESEEWDNYAAHDMRCTLQSEFTLADSTAEWFNDDRLFCLYRDKSSHGTVHDDDGLSFDDSWIKSASFCREDLAAWIVKRRAYERERASKEAS